MDLRSYYPISNVLTLSLGVVFWIQCIFQYKYSNLSFNVDYLVVVSELNAVFAIALIAAPISLLIIYFFNKNLKETVVKSEGVMRILICVIIVIIFVDVLFGIIYIVGNYISKLDVERNVFDGNLFSVDVLKEMGAMMIDGNLSSNWSSIFTCTFLHHNLKHWASNVMNVGFFGAILEREYGSISILILFVIAGVYGNLLGYLFHHNRIAYGASTGSNGLLGGFLGMIIVNGHLMRKYSCIGILCRTLFPCCMIIYFAILHHIFINEGSGINHAGHVGGFIFGVLYGGIVFSDKIIDSIPTNLPLTNINIEIDGYDWRPFWRNYQALVRILSTVLLISFTVMIIVPIVRISNEGLLNCKWCKPFHNVTGHN